MGVGPAGGSDPGPREWGGRRSSRPRKEASRAHEGIIPARESQEMAQLSVAWATNETPRSPTHLAEPQRGTCQVPEQEAQRAPVEKAGRGTLGWVTGTGPAQVGSGVGEAGEPRDTSCWGPTA